MEESESSLVLGFNFAAHETNFFFFFFFGFNGGNDQVELEWPYWLSRVIGEGHKGFTNLTKAGDSKSLEDISTALNGVEVCGRLNRGGRENDLLRVGVEL